MPAEIADFIQKAETNQISTFELRRRYRNDKIFRHWYDIHTGLAQPAAPQPLQLTREQFNSLPTAVVQRWYQQEPAFRAAVDKLQAERQIRVTEATRGFVRR